MHSAGTRAVVIVEGESDQVALETLARCRGSDLDEAGVTILAIGGATNVRRVLARFGPEGMDLPLAGLCDAGEEGHFGRALERAGLGSGLDRDAMEALGFYVCDVDLEDELIRSLGADAVERVIDGQGELRSFRTLQKQAAQQGRSREAQLRRFMGSGSGRKIRYARLLVQALDPSQVPRPLAHVLDRVLLAASDEELLAEQCAFYRWDTEDFDQWLASLVDETNLDPMAVTYRLGRERIAGVFEARAPMGRLLEIAAGTGRLAELYAPHVESAVLLDASPESLTLAGRRLATAHDKVEFVEGDVFAWHPAGQTFDTIVFSAWLHHVPHSRFDGFWATVDAALAPGGEVIFDFPDARITPPGLAQMQSEPTADYSIYAPVDGVSLRDHHGRRWRVVHIRWDPEDLASRLGSLGWTMEILGPGLVGDIVWASARR